MTRPTKRHIRVRDLDMAYVEDGTGDPIIFLHGNPTSSYLWRNIMPGLVGHGRCIVPDLVGMGDSNPLADPVLYSFATHADYMDALLENLDLAGPVTLVVHDWGSALGFDWARMHPDAVKGIAYMEAIVRPLTWDEWPAPSRELFQALRSQAGEELILDKNIFVERILPASIQRNLAAEEMEEYRRPFPTSESRLPTLAWPRNLPIDDSPADVCARVQLYADWMAANDLPKLFINADPGAILTGAQREFCRGWKNQVEVTVPGIHFIQEDSAAEITAALHNWIGCL